ncbi:MAG TPA: hypothetical protein DIU37_04555 [Opitutae bacterium]|nr:hypothetical protein [Opitutae bacterium]|tara:strand:- start:276 stop:659 length:384 start_codon:yes stop_codon:yes gene_type:complete
MKTLLVADDDPVMLKLFEFNLRKAGFQVIACKEGLGVVQKALTEKPELVILDYLLPGRSGLELIHDFKANARLSEVPLIIVTGQGKGTTRDDLMRAGAACVFTKPFSPSLLVQEINRLLTRPVESVR